MAKPRKPSAPKVEGAAFSAPIAAEDFASFVALFKERFPAEWEAMKLCPLQHGLDTMEALLRG